jgi:hypothetical protein
MSWRIRYVKGYDFQLCRNATPHPPLRGTLSPRERAGVREVRARRTNKSVPFRER